VQPFKLGQQSLVDARRGRDDDLAVRAVHRARPSARFGGDEQPRGVVPGLEIQLEERVEMTAADCAQVECGRSDPADVTNLRK